MGTVLPRTGIGQDSHRFDEPESGKPLMLGGVRIPDAAGLRGNSDADVVLHALTNAVSGISGTNVLGAISDEMCRGGTTDSAEYLRYALGTLTKMRLCHVSVAIECATPVLAPHIDAIRASIASLCGIAVSDVGVTATSGEGLTGFGRGEGIQALAIVTAVREE